MSTRCLHPVKFKEGDRAGQTFPCGRCPNCKKRWLSQWSFRLLHELKKCSSAYFLTFTYNTTFLPITRRGLLTLDKTDLQLFFKRLRKSHGRKHQKLVYYAVGEYGGRYKRPHYHVLLFNAKLELIQNAWKNHDARRGPVNAHLGMVHFGDERGVTGGSVGYTLKYVMKPPSKRAQGDDRIREFRLMSKGIGKSYLTDKMIRWHMADIQNRVYCTLEGGKKISMPRYYRDRIYTDMQKQWMTHFNQLLLAEELYTEFVKISARESALQIRKHREGTNAAYRRMYADSAKRRDF